MKTQWSESRQSRGVLWALVFLVAVSVLSAADKPPTTREMNLIGWQEFAERLVNERMAELIASTISKWDQARIFR